MPKIRITDHLNAELISTDAGAGSGISKYFQGDIAGFVASAELVQALGKPISSLGSSPLGFGLSFKNATSFGSSAVEWTVQAGSRSVVTAKPEANRTFLSLAITPTLTLGANREIGDLSFGFSVGSTFEYRTGKTFDHPGIAGPSLREAISELLAKATLPGDVADLAAMEPGDIASLSGSGNFKASAQFDLAAAMNPLATPTLGLKAIGALQIKAGASLSIGTSVGIKGSYKIRVTKLDDKRVALAFFKMAGTEFEFEVNASAGISATLGGRDFLTRLLTGLSTAPKADVVDLVDAGLSDDQIAEIQTAIKSSIQRSLALSLMAGFSLEATDESVFEYEFDLSLLDPDATEALHHALDGDLSALTSRTNLPPGVRMIRSQFDKLRRKAFTWKINLLGIVNVFHLTEFIRSGKVLFDAVSGELIITDSVTHKEILVKTRPFEADAEKLRKVLMKSIVLTAAYRATGLRNFLSFKCSQTYFDQVASARKQTASDFLDHFLALRLIDQPEKDAFLAAPISGPASLYLDLALDDASFAAMFSGASKQEDYDEIGRQCILHLIQPADENSFRRIPMEDDNLWRQMTALGQFSMRAAMPPALRADLPFALVQHDYTVIRWWSAAMSAAAGEVAAMRTFLNGADPETLKDNNDFKKKREELSKAMGAIVKNAQPDFLDAWGILAMDAASQNQAAIRATLLTKSSFLVKSRP